MKQLSQLSVVKEVSASKPFGAIINETDTNDGTPVVREIYNDPLINIYKLLEMTGITPDGTEDGETNGVGSIPKYQVVEALQKLANVLNDVEQVLSLSSGVWSVGMDITLLPDKYVFIARATDNYVSGTFKGNKVSPVYSFYSPGFNASDEIIVIIDQSEVRAYSISGIFGNTANELFTLMGTPVAYNSENLLYFQEDGKLISETPSVALVEEIIRADVADNTVLVTDMFVMQGYLLCVVFFPTEITYKFFQFPIGDLTVSEEVAQAGFTMPIGTDNNPYFFSDGEAIYVTNANGTTINDYEISNISYNPATPNLVWQSQTVYDNTYVKTTNTAIKNKVMYYLVSGILSSIDVNTGTKTVLGNYSGIIGLLFNYKDNIYFTSGEVAKKWF